MIKVPRTNESTSYAKMMNAVRTEYANCPHDVYGQWEYLIVPLISKIFLPGEVAESMGEERILEALQGSTEKDAQGYYTEATDSDPDS